MLILTSFAAGEGQSGHVLADERMYTARLLLFLWNSPHELLLRGGNPKRLHESI